MKVAFSTNGGDSLEAQVSPIFGRCVGFLIVDTETMECVALPNASVGLSGGAGISAAQNVAQQGVEAVVTGNVGPNAMSTLVAGGISVYTVQGGTVGEAVEALKQGKLQSVGDATVPRDFAKPGGGAGRGRGLGMGGGMGRRG